MDHLIPKMLENTHFTILQIYLANQNAPPAKQLVICANLIEPLRNWSIGQY